MRGAMLSFFPLPFLALALAGGGTRYLDPIFADVDVRSDLRYGQAFNARTGLLEDLYLDLYRPIGDTATDRWSVVLVHGGGFHSGSKENAELVALATDYAKRGYVAVSIDYRLGLLSPAEQDDPDLLGQAIGYAASDTGAAIRWLRKRAGALKLDPTRVAAFGFSAGAASVLAITYVDGIEAGNTSNPGFDSRPTATTEVAGALVEDTTIDLDDGNVEAGEGPLCVIHGENDHVIDVEEAFELIDACNAAGVTHTDLIVPGANHGIMVTHYTDVLNTSAQFFYDQM